MQGLEINPGFEHVLSFINQTNRLVFLTGKAGTGKTTLLRYIQKNTFKQMAIVAPTGVAAINAGGATIHSFFQFPFGPFVIGLKENGQPDASKNHAVLKYNAQRLAIFRNLELLVIDEISMVRADLLDQIDVTLRQTRKKWHLPFGGVQVLFIGDMYQLPPVVQPEEWKLLKELYQSPFFFESKALRQNPPVFIELEKIYRQSDQVFINLLNNVRTNNLSQNDIDLLNKHYKAEISDQEYNTNITLTTHNRKADEINTRNLEKLSAESFIFRSDTEGAFSEKNFPAEENLRLKEGARVMFLKNNPEKNYYNGKIGMVSFLSKEKIKVICDEDKQEVEVGREVWTNVSYSLDKTNGHIDEEILGTFTQYPLRLAWAITIHKSQGLTFSNLIIDAADSFSAGQVYVALSRCRSLEGLILSSKIRSSTLLNDKAIVRFSETKQNSSELNRIFSNAQQDYFKNLLISLFDCSELLLFREDLGATVQMYSTRFNDEGKQWLNLLYSKIEALQEISVKFRNQLSHLLSQTLAIESDENLQERIKKGSVYFWTELKNMLDDFKNCTLSTESKEAAESANEILQQLFEEIFRKYALIQSCDNGFIFSDFVKQKLNFVFPGLKINIYATARNAKVSAHIRYPSLYRSLLVLRDEICNDDHKPIYMVASNKTIETLSEYLPASKSDLLLIKGFGDAKVETYGDRFLKIINEFRIENDLPSFMDTIEPQKGKKAKNPKKEINRDKSEEPKISSKEQTFRLYKQGLNPAEIAKQRGMTQGTVESHLTPFVGSGDIDINALVSPEKQTIIHKILHDVEEGAGLALIKSMLPETITFTDIRYVLAEKKRLS